MKTCPSSSGRTKTSWLAPTKVNLFLHITGRIEEPPFHGYHALQTYFQLIDYGDQLKFMPTDTTRLEIDWVAGDEDVEHKPLRIEDDLIHRAATLLGAHPVAQGKNRSGMRITLVKNAPVGGGMGGGSSAAATTLIALNHYWKLGLDRAALMEIGLKLGADVPIFVAEHSTWAEGIGEKLTPMPSPVDKCWFVIVVPRASSWTSQLFAHPELPRDTARQDPSILLPRWREVGFNAFEQILLNSDGMIQRCFEALHRETGFARVTGSGACIFTPVENQAHGLDVAEKIRQNTPEIKRVIVAPALTHTRPPIQG